MVAKKYDNVFFGIVCALVLSGFFILFSASLGLLGRNTTGFYFNVILKQIVFGIIGIILFFIFSKIDYKKWKKFALPIFLFSFVLTLLVFAPGIGMEHGGAKRWIDLGFISFQPSEILKFGFLLYLSSWLATRKNEIKSFKLGFLPFLVIIGFIAVSLILEPDIGTLGVITITSLFLFFISGGRFSQVAIFILIGIILLFTLIMIKPYLMHRVTIFLNPSLDPQGIGYQLNQSLISIGSGGMLGRGFGMSVQKFKYLPEPIGDSIFAVVGEEFGFIGSILLIGLFLLFMYRGFYISSKAPDMFGRLLGSGIVILILVQSFINIGAMIGVLPLTGIPLLFVSQGGTALVVVLAEAGVLLNISRHI